MIRRNARVWGRLHGCSKILRFFGQFWSNGVRRKGTIFKTILCLNFKNEWLCAIGGAENIFFSPSGQIQVNLSLYIDSTVNILDIRELEGNLFLNGFYCTAR